MPYCTQTEIEKLIPRALLVELTDDENLGGVNLDRLDEAISQADAEIDAYISRRYSVPVEPVPALLRKLSGDMAVYHLYSRTVQSMPEVRRERYTDAVRRLEAIARGIAGLGIAEEPAPAAQQSGAETNVTSGSQVFTRGSMEGY
jgi:phage gp36-like protein